MKRKPKIGEIGEIRFRVTEEHAIDFADNQMPAVLSTPWLVWFLEHAAREAMLPLLEETESTVGAVVEVRHLAATPLGHEVLCRARVINSDGSLISFQIEAFDEEEKIAHGLHKLQVIETARFRSRVLKKVK